MQYAEHPGPRRPRPLWSKVVDKPLIRMSHVRLESRMKTFIHPAVRIVAVAVLACATLGSLTAVQNTSAPNAAATAAHSRVILDDLGWG